MVSALILSLGKTLYSHSASLYQRVQMGTGKFNAGGNPVMDKHPIQGRSRNTPSCFMLQKPQKSASLMAHLARVQTFFTDIMKSSV